MHFVDEAQERFRYSQNLFVFESVNHHSDIETTKKTYEMLKRFT